MKFPRSLYGSPDEVRRAATSIVSRSVKARTLLIPDERLDTAAVSGDILLCPVSHPGRHFRCYALLQAIDKRLTRHPSDSWLRDEYVAIAISEPWVFLSLLPSENSTLLLGYPPEPARVGPVLSRAAQFAPIFEAEGRRYYLIIGPSTIWEMPSTVVTALARTEGLPQLPAAERAKYVQTALRRHQSTAIQS